MIRMETIYIPSNPTFLHSSLDGIQRFIPRQFFSSSCHINHDGDDHVVEDQDGNEMEMMGRMTAHGSYVDGGGGRSSKGKNHE